MLLMIFIALVHVALQVYIHDIAYPLITCILCALYNYIGVFWRVVEMGDTERRH